MMVNIIYQCGRISINWEMGLQARLCEMALMSLAHPRRLT